MIEFMNSNLWSKQVCICSIYMGIILSRFITIVYMGIILDETCQVCQILCRVSVFSSST